MAKNKVLEAIVDVSGSIDPSLGKAVNEATSFISGLNLKAIAAAGAVGGIAVATGKMVLEAGEYLLNLGTQFDQATDTIRIGTGATGEALDELLDDFDAIYSSVPAEMEQVSQAVADFNTRLGLTGPELQEISKQAIQVSDMLGDDLGAVIEESSQALSQWNIDSADMGDAMDYIFKVSQSTGQGFNTLMTSMQKFGPQLQEMGFGFEYASTMMGAMDKAGVNTEEVLAGMKKGMATMAKEGISAADGWQQYTDAIMGAADMTEATNIAAEIFGARAGPTMASAIRSGAMDVAALTAELQNSQETISGAAEDTYDFAERLQLMKQNLEVALKPIANTIFDKMNDFMPALQRILEAIIPVILDLVDAALPFVEDFLDGAVVLLEQLIPMISGLAESLMPVLTDLISTLLPPLLELINAILPPIMEIVTAILPTLAGILTQILPMIVQIANAVLPVIMEILTSLLPVITPILDILMEILNTVILPLLPPIMQLVEALLPVVVSLLSAIMPLLEPLVAILTPIAEVLATIVGWITDLVNAAAGGIEWLMDLFGGGGGSGPSGYAAGGFTSGTSIAGEDPNYPVEAVISFNPAYRDKNLQYWALAGRMLGATDDGGSHLSSATRTSTAVYEIKSISFAPQIIVDGDTNAAKLLQMLKDKMPELADMLLDEIDRRKDGDFDDGDDEL